MDVEEEILYGTKVGLSRKSREYEHGYERQLRKVDSLVSKYESREQKLN